MTDTIVPTQSEAPAAFDELPLGTRVDRYLLLDRLGAGGMGVVYRAYDPDLDRNIALKLVRAERKNAERRQRLREHLLREAQALAQLSHPNVVAVHDVGTFRDDVFVAMELVDGVTLRSAFGERPCVSTVVEHYCAAARGLAAAHAVDIVHRDFKPDNAIVSPDGEVHVLDFGLALALEDDDARALVGTPGYMPPEQLAGQAVDARSDQYSFCVSLYEALYRKLPDEPPPARTAWSCRVPKRVRAALARGLSPEPADRHASMLALVDALRPRPLHRAVPIAGGVALAAAAAAIVVAVRSPDDGPRCDGFAERLTGVWDAPRRDAVKRALDRHGDGAPIVRLVDRYTTAWIAMHAESCRATASGAQSPELLDLRSDCLGQRLEEVRHVASALAAADAKTAARAAMVVYGLSPLDRCANATALRDPLPPRDEQRARALRAQLPALRVAYSLGDYEAARDGATRLVAEAEAAGDRWLAGETQYLRARALRGLGDLAAAEDQLYRAIETAEAGRASEVAADAWMTLAWIVGEDRGRIADALRFAGVARGVIERMGGNPRLEAALEDHLGVLHLDQGALTVARHHLERSLALRERTFGADDPDTAASLQHVALLEQASGNREKALELHRRARAISESHLGSTHDEVLAMIGGEAATLYELGRYAEANTLLEKTLPVAERAAGPRSELVASLLVNLGLARWKLGRHADARATFERALAITKPDGPRAANIHLNLALVLVDGGPAAQAIPHAEQAARRFEALQGADSPDVALALEWLAMAHTKSGAPAAAVAPLERALAIRTKHAGGAIDLAVTRFDLAKALAATKADRARARQLAEAARDELERAGDADGAREVAAWLRTQ